MRRVAVGNRAHAMRPYDGEPRSRIASFDQR
jgi:hypothetical protein